MKNIFLFICLVLCTIVPYHIFASHINVTGENPAVDSLIFPVESANNPNYGIYGGDLYIETLGSVITLTASTGSCWEISIAGDGTMHTDSVPCPAGINPVDGDGNLYSKLIIGDQVWTGESLQTTSFNDGTPISKMINNSDIQDKTVDNPVPGYVNWQFTDSNAPLYGTLYNYLVIDPASNGGYNVCPTGYKLPSIADFQELVEFLEPGAPNNATNTLGSKLKYIGNQSNTSGSLWLNQNGDATNSSGFSAQPGSYYLPFGFAAAYASFWLSDVDNATNPPTINAFSMVNNNTWSSYGGLPNNFLYLSKIRCIEE